MDIEVDIQRKDLVALSLHMLPRDRANWVTLAVLAVGIFVFIVVTKRPASPHNMGVAAVASLAGGVIGLLIGLAIQLLTMLLTVGKKSGVLGKHRFSLTDVGLREVTEANDSLQKWGGIQEIIRLPNCILFRINSYLFHVVPRRAFGDEQQFLAFYEKAKILHGAG